MFRDSQRISTISDDEPLYDSVASDEDYSSIDTQSIKSVREEMRPDITAEVRNCHCEVKVFVFYGYFSTPEIASKYFL